MQHLGYKFSGSQEPATFLQYADDACLISEGPESCKRLLKGRERWLDWIGMKAKVPKCHSLALRASTAKTYDPKLHLHDPPIHFLGNQTTRFLGETVQIPFASKSSRITLFTKLSTMLKKVDAVPITSHQKLLLYRVHHVEESGCCPHHLSPETTPVPSCCLPQTELGQPTAHVVGNSHTGSINNKVPGEVDRPG